MKINWNLEDPLRFQRNFQFADGENTVIKFRFERLRNFCSKCGSLKHDVKECTLAFDDEDPAVISEDDDDDNDEDHQDDNKDKDMSDTDTLQTVDPATLIPRLQASIPRETQSNVMKRPISSAFLRAFEDTDLNVERLRYLHAKLARVRTHTPVESDLLLDSSDNALNPFVFMKRKRVQFEQLFQEVEEAEEMAVLSHLCKKERKTESAGSCSIHGGIDGGAGGPGTPKGSNMKIASWNCQGIGVPLTQSRLSRLLRIYKFDILFLIETMNRCDVLCNLAGELGYPNVITQPRIGRSGGLALMWKNNVSLSLISQDERLIDTYVTYNNKSFYLFCVYGHPVQTERYHLWETLEQISNYRNDEWLLMGDFNEILSND